MFKRSSLMALVGAVSVGLLAAGDIQAYGGTAGAGAFERRPLVEFLFENLGRLAKLRRQLQLTPEQRGKLKEMIKVHKPEIVAAIGKIREGRKKVQAAVRAEPPNEVAIRSAAASMSGPLAEAAVLRAKIRREALALLTPEQRGKVDRFIAETQESADEAFDEFAGK